MNHPPAMFGESAPKIDKAAGGKGRTTRYTRGSWQDSVFAVASDGALRVSLCARGFSLTHLPDLR